MIYDALVIGGGQAGLAAGYHLQKQGFHFLILESSHQPAGSWPSYYRSLKLFSPAGYSSLPGLPFPGDRNRYPTRDEVIEYLTSYARHFQLPVVTGTRVTAVEQAGSYFRVHTTEGSTFSTRAVIAATGSFSRPYIPELPGQTAFQGEILHASTYCCPDSFAGKRIIVVGSGNSAVQIGVELAQIANVTLATRRPINFVRQRILGLDVHFWTWISGMDRRKSSIDPKGRHVLDAGIYREAVAVGKPDRREMFKAFTDTGVIWHNDQPEAVDTVIMATGYRPNLGYLSGLGALDHTGNALQNEGISATTPGLYFMGISNQRAYASATLRGVGRDAAFVVQHLAQHLEQFDGSVARCCPLPAAS